MYGSLEAKRTAVDKHRMARSGGMELFECRDATIISRNNDFRRNFGSIISIRMSSACALVKKDRKCFRILEVVTNHVHGRKRGDARL